MKGVLELGPVLLVTLAHVALQVMGLLVATIAEAMRALEGVLGFVAELVRYQFSVASEGFAASCTGEMGLGDSVEPVFAVLRYVRCDRDVVPVEADPFLKFRNLDVFAAVVIEIRAIFEAVNAIETSWNLNLDLFRSLRS